MPMIEHLYMLVFIVVLGSSFITSNAYAQDTEDIIPAFAQNYHDASDVSNKVILRLYPDYSDKWFAQTILYVCEKKGLLDTLINYDSQEQQSIIKSIVDITTEESLPDDLEATQRYIIASENKLEGFKKGLALSYTSFYEFLDTSTAKESLCNSGYEKAEKFLKSRQEAIKK